MFRRLLDWRTVGGVGRCVGWWQRWGLTINYYFYPSLLNYSDQQSRTITDRLTTTGAAQSYNISPRCCTIFHNYRSALNIQQYCHHLSVPWYTIVHNCGPVPSPHILILHILKRIFCSRVPAATGSNTTHNNPIMLPPPPAPVININTTETVTILKCFPDHYCNVLPLLAFKNLHSRDFYRILSKACSTILHHGPHYQRLQQICNTAAAAPSNEFSLDRCNLMYIVDGEAGMPH